MNINDFLSPHIIFWFEIALCISLGVALLIYVFLAYRRLEYMEHLLNKCSFVVFYTQFLDNSPRGRMMRFGAVAVAVLLPKRNLKRGVIDWQQVQEFPRSLKRLFRGIYFVIVVVFMYGIFFWLPK